MKLQNFTYYAFFVLILIFSISLILRNEKIKNKTPYIDLPKEWNEHTISQDRMHPTELMAIYDTNKQKYIIEFIDK
jgi:hypothetical protein